VQEINDDCVVLRTPAGPLRLPNDFVFALTGYHPDYDFLRSVGIELATEQLRPVCDPENLESNVPGVYVAGRDRRWDRGPTKSSLRMAAFTAN
jgi:thioredoxin reductase (NADPH)